MKIRAKISMRNDAAVSARERLGLTQEQVAAIVGTRQGHVSEIERLDFTRMAGKMGERVVAEMAELYGVSVEDLMPAELVGKQLRNKAEVVKDLPVQAVLGMASDVPSAEHKLIGEEVHAAIGEALDGLTFREREIVKLRYGMGGEGEYTLEEVGRIFRVSRERVRAIEQKALRKLGHPDRAKKIRLAVDGEA